MGTRVDRDCAVPTRARLAARSLSVSAGFFDGTRFDLSSGLNCIIGNRGTGKTTAIELIRYALDDLGSDPKQRRRVEALVQQNLGGGRVELEIETTDGIRYAISRTAGDAPIVYTADGEPSTVAIGAGGDLCGDALCPFLRGVC